MVDGQIVTEEILRTRSEEAYKKDPMTSVILAADQEARHGSVVKVIGIFKGAGLSNFAIQVEKRRILHHEPIRFLRSTFAATDLTPDPWTCSDTVSYRTLCFSSDAYNDGTNSDKNDRTEAPVAAKEPPQAVRLSDVRPLPKPVNAPVPVFGLSNRTLQDTSGTSTVEIKAGNTIAKEFDNLKATNDDALPIPTDEFLVTQMPRIKKEVRAPYPDAARNARVEGPIVLDLLINADGMVVDVKLISGLGYGLDEAAINAIKLFEFEPARVQNQKVAVKIRYTYRFELRS
jgi:protein TonB